MSENEGQVKAKGKKKRKGKKGKGKKSIIVLPDRPFYEKTITDANNELSKLRSTVTRTDEKFLTLKNELREIEEDHSDVAAHVGRVLIVRNQTIQELEEELNIITKLIEVESLEHMKKIKALNAEFKERREELTFEFTLQSSSLSSLDEYRLERDLLFTTFHDSDDIQQDMIRMHKQKVQIMEQKAIVYKDKLKKSIGAKMESVWDDATQSNEIRNASYTRQLIHENIKLHKEIDQLSTSEIEIDRRYEYSMQKQKESENQITLLDETEKQLKLNAQNQLGIIEKIATEYEHLKAERIELGKFRKMYKAIAKHNATDFLTKQDLIKEISKLEQRVQELKRDAEHAKQNENKQEIEVKRLSTLAKNMKEGIQRVIVVSDLSPRLKKTNRRQLLFQLIGMLTNPPGPQPYYDAVMAGMPVYQTGKLGIVPRTTQLCVYNRTLKQEKRLSTKSTTRKLSGKMVAKSRAKDCETLFDAGAEFSVSSSHDTFDVEEEVVVAETSSSSETVTSASVHLSPILLTPQPSPLDPSVWKICGRATSDVEYDADEE